MGIRKKVATLLAATALLTGINLAVTASPAAAVTCSGWEGPNFDTGSGVLKGTYNLKKGPYGSCATVAPLPGGTRIFFHCWVWNDYDNLWVYGRVAETQTYGWMSIDNFVSTSSSGSIWGMYPQCHWS